MERSIAKSKVERQRLLRIADNFRQTQSNVRLACCFQAWFDQSEPYRLEKRVKKSKERKAICMLVIRGFKMFTEQMQKAKQIAVERKAAKLQTLKRKIFKALKAEREGALAEQGMVRSVKQSIDKRCFKAWKEVWQIKEDSRHQEQFIRKRINVL